MYKRKINNLEYSYDPETGIVTRECVINGQIVLNGKKDTNGYISIAGLNKHFNKNVIIENKVVQHIHRLAWYIVYGVLSDRYYVIDHIDRNKTNNKLNNLQLVTQFENAKNQ